MPLSGYFHGGGEKVMSSMQKEYGAKKGKQVFYATANKKAMRPMDEHKDGQRELATRRTRNA